MATKTAKPKGVIKKSAPTPFKPKSLGKAVTPTKKPTLPTTKRSVGTQVPSAPKPKGVVKSIKPSGVAKAPKTSYTAPMAKPKGVIAGVNKVLDVASMYPGVGGLVSAVASKATAKLAGVTRDGTPVFMRRKRRRGLTYSDIKGATRVLKLVKKFAPPGSRAKLRVRPRTY